MFDTDDPRAGLGSMPIKERTLASAYAGAEYARFYETQPQELDDHVRTWHARGQNLIVSYSEVSGGATFTRTSQPDEYILLLPDHDARAEITAGGVTESVGGFSLTIVPPGSSSISMHSAGRVVRLFTVASADLAHTCSNAASYAVDHPNVAPLRPWPEPFQGFRVRSYSLAVPLQPGRFGRIWRSSTLMVNYLEPWQGPRDATKLSPHSHEDFEQCSLALDGEFVHHIRWPWTSDIKNWRPDDHEFCASPSLVVIPPPTIHTSQAVGRGTNQLVDIFCPPRADFSEKPGWVLNADEYPMPSALST